MRRKHILRLAFIMQWISQWISGILAIIVIYPLYGLLLPCWRRLGRTRNRRKASHLHSISSQSRYSPSGKPLPQDK